MKIKTKAYGQVEISADDIITFEHGLIGFAEKQKFILLGNPEVNEIIIWLQSLEDENLALVIMQPRFFWPEYKPELNIQELEDLIVEDEQDLLVYVILVIPAEARDTTANLRAPIIVNVKNNKAKQVVLKDERYKIKEQVFAEK